MIDAASRSANKSKFLVDNGLRRRGGAGITLADFYLDYQPIYRLQSGTLIGVEALLRHPKVANPLDLLGLARKEQMLPDWELAIFDRAVCEVLANGAGVDVLFFNLSPEAYIDEKFHDRMVEILMRYRISPSSLCVEISEGAVYSEDVYKDRLFRWTSLGCYVALDDFGSGGSNVSLVVAAKPDYAKIDRSLVYGLSSSRKLQVALESILSILIEHEVFPIIEGVELPEDLVWLRRSAHDVGVQGFAVARPGPLAVVLGQSPRLAVEA